MIVSSSAHRAYRLKATLALAGVGFVLAASSPTKAVIVYDIPGSGQNTSPPPGGQGFQYIGAFSVGGGATVVAPQVIITANHLGPGVGNIFTYNNVVYSVDYVEQVGTSDIELAHLAVSTGSAGVPLYTGTAAAGNAVTITGFGGPKGAALTNNAPPSGPVNYGWAWTAGVNTPSWGNNTLSGIVSDGNGHGFAAISFQATAGSSIFTGGDSGSGMFINVGGTYELMGVTYGVDGYWNNTQAATNPNVSVSSPAYVESVADSSAANLDATAANTLYTIYTNSLTHTNFYGPATSANPQQGYASLIDNDSNFTVNGQTVANYLNQRIAALSATVSSTWTATSGAGIWSTTANWSNGLPLNAGCAINFTGAGTVTTVTIDSQKEAGILSFSGTLAYTLNGLGQFNMDNTGGIGNASVNSSSSATQTFSSHLTTVSGSNLNVNSTGGGILAINGGIDNTAGQIVTLNATGGSTISTGAIINNGSLVLTGSNSNLNLGAISGTGSLTVAPSYGLSPTNTAALTLATLTTTSTTTLQFNLVTPNAAAGVGSDTITVGANNLTLNGGAINLTNHATGAASLGFYKVIAYSGTINGTGLSSLTLPATTNNVAYTFDTTHDPGFIDIHRGFLGDVDDSGFVDINDLATLAAHWQQPGGWAQGNFLGDAVVDINDLSVLAAHWQTGIASFGEAADALPGTSESFQQAVANVIFSATNPVPEPASLALLGIAAACLLTHRRIRQ